MKKNNLIVYNQPFNVTFDTVLNKYSALFDKKIIQKNRVEELYTELEKLVLEKHSLIQITKEFPEDNLFFYKADISSFIEKRLIVLTNEEKTMFTPYLKQQHMQAILKYKQDREKGLVSSIVSDSCVIYFIDCYSNNEIDYLKLEEGLNQLPKKKEYAIEQLNSNEWEYIVYMLRQNAEENQNMFNLYSK